MKINLIRYSNSLDPNATYLKDSNQFIEDINNELFNDDIELVESCDDASYSIVFIETGGSEQKFVKDVDTLPRPIVLLSNCKNNSLPACFEIKTYLESKKIENALLFGNEVECADQIRRLSDIFRGVNKIKGNKLGVIGKPSDWLIASVVDYKKVKEKFDIELIDITTSELKEEIDKGILPNIPNADQLRKLAFDQEVFDGALKIYSGLKRIIKKYDLKGFTLRCFDLIGEYKNTACLAFAILNEEGYIAACEGDVPSLLTMQLIKGVTGQSSFQANPSNISLKDKTVLFAHCTLPLNMCTKTELMTHFESGLGIGVRGTLELGNVTIVKIAPDLKNILCISGEITENLTLLNYCRTQINVKMDGENLFELLKEPFGNHVLICYGDVQDDIVTAFHFMVD